MCYQQSRDQFSDTIADDINAKGKMPLSALDLTALNKVQIHLQNGKGVGRLATICSDHLRGLQRICAPLVHWYCQDRQDLPYCWQTEVELAQCGVTAVIVMLYVATSRAQEPLLSHSSILSLTPAVLVTAFEICVMPLLETPPGGRGRGDIWEAAKSAKDELSHLLGLLRILLDLVATACETVEGIEVDDISATTTEFLTIKLIFAQYSEAFESSVLSSRSCDSLRTTATDVLTRLYARFPCQRSTILCEVLVSIDRSCSRKSNVHKYHLLGGGKIDLVTMLLMQLVQIASIDREQPTQDLLPEGSRSFSSCTTATPEGEELDSMPARDPVNSARQLLLHEKAGALFDRAAKSAQEIVAYLITRASHTTKSGDAPHRAILDDFVQDLILVLPCPEWPAAELLLRVLTVHMLKIAARTKSVSAKNMAVKYLGRLGSAILKLRHSSIANHTSRGSECEQRAPIANIWHRFIDTSNGFVAAPLDNLVAWDGLLRLLAQLAATQPHSNALLDQSAKSYFLAHYAKLVDFAASAQVNVQSRVPRESSNLLAATSDRTLIYTRSTLTRDDYRSVYAICVLNLPFCHRVHDIVQILVECADAASSQVRHCSVRSLQEIVDSEPAIIEYNPQMLKLISRCAGDDSSRVRETALSILSRSLTSRSAWQEVGLTHLFELANDPNISVTKRAITCLTNLYCTADDELLRALVAQKVLQRSNDPEVSIAKSAKQALRAMWIEPVVVVLQQEEASAKVTTMLQNLATHFVRCLATRANDLKPSLRSFFIHILHDESKTKSLVCVTCEKLVEVLVELLPAENNRGAVPTLLAALTEAKPEVVKPSQVAKLQKYLRGVASEADLFLFRAVTQLLCKVLPELPLESRSVLRSAQNDLFTSVGKLGRRLELDLVIKCLSRISCVLQDTRRLARLTISCMDQVSRTDLTSAALRKLLRILGSIGQFTELDDTNELIAKRVRAANADSVAALLAELVHGLTSQDYAPEVRLTALESLGGICRASPFEFTRPPITATFLTPLRRCSSNAQIALEQGFLRIAVLRVWEELYNAYNDDEHVLNNPKSNGGNQELKQLGVGFGGHDHDNAISSITPELVDCLLDTAMADLPVESLLALKILCSISRQGRVHPRQLLGAFVTLSAVQRHDISTLAQSAHSLLHGKYGLHCEREYVSAVMQAFQYQMHIDHDPTGAAQVGCRAKLCKCFEVITTGSERSVKNFLCGLVSKCVVNCSDDFRQMVVPCDHPLFVRFIVHNLAFWEYKRVNQLTYVISQLELNFSKMTDGLLAALDSTQQAYPDIPRTAIMPDVMLPSGHEEISTRDPIFVLHMKRMGPAAVIWSLLVETRIYLIRQYGLHLGKEKRGESVPIRVPGIRREEFWSRSNDIVHALNSDEAIVRLCEKVIAMQKAEEATLTNAYGPVTDVASTFPPQFSASKGIQAQDSDRHR